MRLFHSGFGALVLGFALGLAVVCARTPVRGRTDWRASELTAWCNHYRGVATMYRDRISALVFQLSPDAVDDPDWIWRASVADEAIHDELKMLEGRVREDQFWFRRCSPTSLPYTPDDDFPLRGSRAFVAYLEVVIASIPHRDPADPSQYVAPVEH